jgi:F420-dependent oxidoreductase-like protein
MKLGIKHTGVGTEGIDIEFIKAAESMGFDSVWTSEAYGSDAVSPATWILAQTTKIKVGTAIMQMTARTPTMAAMTAMTLNLMSGGRFIPGVGASGPQVVEGWHSSAYGRPLERTREYITIMKKVFAREAPLEHHGFHYDFPYRGEDGTGLGKPLKSILAANAGIPIYTASITPNGLETSAEVSDGSFPIWMSPEKFEVLGSSIQKGLDKAGKSLSDYDVAPFVTVSMGSDLEESRLPVKNGMAFYIGAMGSRKKNFYKDYATAMGFEEAAAKIQDLFLSGKREEAAAAVPDELVDSCHLVGPAERIRERLQVWKQAGAEGKVGTMVLSATHIDALELVAKEVL